MAPGTNNQTNLNAMLTLSGNCIFTNTALTDDGDVWWEGMTEEKPAHLTDWKGQDWTPDSETPAAHPNARFTAAGGPGSRHRARVGGSRRRADLGHPVRRAPLVGRAADHRGVRLAARGVPRLDHGLGDHRRRRRCGRQAAARPVRHAALLRLQHGRLLRPLARDRPPEPIPPTCPVFSTSTGSARAPDGKFLWPGYGENSRVLEWVFERCAGRGEAVETPIGYPAGTGRHPHATAWTCPRRPWPSCSGSTPDEWRQELQSIAAHFDSLGDRVPPELLDELARLEKRLG